jgi:hypothetical protein
MIWGRDVRRATALVGSAAIGAVVLCGMAPPATAEEPATTLLVSPTDYATIPLALAAARPGDTILVAPGDYEGDFTVDKAVTLATEGSATITGKVTLAAPATIRGFTLEDDGNNRIVEVDATAAGSVIRGNLIRGIGNAVDMGVFVENAAGTAEAPTVVADNTFRNFVTPGGGAVVTSFPRLAHVAITGNVFDNGDAPGGVGINLRDGSSDIRITGNTFRALSSGVLSISTGRFGNGVAHDLWIADNDFEAMSSRGVYVGPNHRSVTVADNVFRGPGAAMTVTPYVLADVSVIAPLDDIVFSHNDVQEASYGVRVLDGVQLGREGAVTSEDNAYRTITSGIAVASEATGQPKVFSIGDALGAAGVRGRAVIADPPVLTQVGPSALQGTIDVGVDGIAPFWDAPKSAGNTAGYATSASARPGALPGSPWRLNNGTGVLPGDWSATTPAGLTLSVEGGAGASSAWEKARFSYFVGSGGYPAIDAKSPTLADVFSYPLSWSQTYNSGDTAYGPVLQIKLEKQLPSGQWVWVTAVSSWRPGTGDVVFDGPNSWFANTEIYTDGLFTGTLANRAASGPGVSRETLLKNFGDFTVVSFGPNLGRDRTYSYSIQDFTILGQTFHFVGALDPGTPVVSGVVRVGETVTASAGEGWGPGPVSFAYQWLRDGLPIPGAATADYVVAPEDAGRALSVRVTGALPGYEPASATSAATTTAFGALVTTTPRLSASNGTYTVDGVSAQVPVSVAYQWFRDGVPIGGATGASYTRVLRTDLGATLTVRVTVSAAGYATGQWTSAGMVVSGGSSEPPSDAATNPVVPPPVAVTVPASAEDLPQELELPVTPPPPAPTPQPGEMRTLTLDLGPTFANTWFYVTLYSEPTVIGWRWVGADGRLSFAVPQSLPAGEHTVALLDETGAVVGFVSGVSVPEAAVAVTLPATGVDGDAVSRLLVAGGIAVLLGLVLAVVPARRRSRR